MSRKVVQGPIRDKEKTKQRLLNAVGKIIKSKGFQSLQLTKIATAAGVDKELVYKYFGSTDKLLNEYLRSKDYWNSINEKDLEINLSDGGKDACKKVFVNQFDQLYKNKELQKIILWELSEYKRTLKELAESREEIGEGLFKTVTDPYFGANKKKYRAVMAVLASSIYYLNIHTDVNGSTFCGLDLKNDDDRDIVESVMIDMIDNAYKDYK